MQNNKYEAMTAVRELKEENRTKIERKENNLCDRGHGF